MREERVFNSSDPGGLTPFKRNDEVVFVQTKRTGQQLGGKTDDKFSSGSPKLLQACPSERNRPHCPHAVKSGWPHTRDGLPSKSTRVSRSSRLSRRALAGTQRLPPPSASRDSGSAWSQI